MVRRNYETIGIDCPLTHASHVWKVEGKPPGRRNSTPASGLLVQKGRHLLRPSGARITI